MTQLVFYREWTIRCEENTEGFDYLKRKEEKRKRRKKMKPLETISVSIFEYMHLHCIRIQIN